MRCGAKARELHPTSDRTYLDRAEDPKNERLNNAKRRGTHAKSEVDADVLAHMRVPAVLLIKIRPVFEPNIPACGVLAYLPKSGNEKMEKMKSERQGSVRLNIPTDAVCDPTISAR